MRLEQHPRHSEMIFTCEISCALIGICECFHMILKNAEECFIIQFDMYLHLHNNLYLLGLCIV